MRIYKRQGARAPVYWSPEHTEIAKEAVESVNGPVDDYPVDVSDEEADKVRAEYERLNDQQTTGGPS